MAAPVFDDDEVNIQGVLDEHDKFMSKQALFKHKEEGSVYLRVIPQANDPDGRPRKYFEKYGVHFSFKELSNNPFAPYTVRCLHLSFHQNCPGCERNEEIKLRSVGPNGVVDKVLKELAWQSRPQDRYVLNVLQILIKVYF